MYLTAISLESSIILLILSTNSGSFEKVILIHSPAISEDERYGSQASLPKAYQFACPKGCPVQLVSFPTFETPAIAVSDRCPIVPSITPATVDPLPLAHVSDRRHSSKRGARNTRWTEEPRYSCVIWNSGIRFVEGIDPKSG